MLDPESKSISELFRYACNVHMCVFTYVCIRRLLLLTTVRQTQSRNHLDPNPNPNPSAQPVTVNQTNFHPILRLR